MAGHKKFYDLGAWTYLRISDRYEYTVEELLYMLEEEGWSVHRKFLETQYLSMRKYEKLYNMLQ